MNDPAQLIVVTAREMLHETFIASVFGMWGYKRHGLQIINEAEQITITIVNSTVYLVNIADEPAERISFHGQRNDSVPLPAHMSINNDDATVILTDLANNYTAIRDAVLASVPKTGGSRSRERSVQSRLNSLRRWRAKLKGEPTQADIIAGLKLLSKEQAQSLRQLESFEGQEKFNKFAQMLEDGNSAPALLLFSCMSTARLVSMHAAVEEAEDVRPPLRGAVTDITVGNRAAETTRRNLRVTTTIQNVTKKMLKFLATEQFVMYLVTIASQIFSNRYIVQESALNHNILQNNITELVNRTNDSVELVAQGQRIVSNLVNATEQTFGQAVKALDVFPQVVRYAADVSEKMSTPRVDDASEKAYCNTLVTSVAGSMGMATSHILLKRRLITSLNTLTTGLVGNYVAPMICWPAVAYSRTFDTSVAPSWFRYLYNKTSTSSSSPASPGTTTTPAPSSSSPPPLEPA